MNTDNSTKYINILYKEFVHWFEYKVVWYVKDYFIYEQNFSIESIKNLIHLHFIMENQEERHNRLEDSLNTIENLQNAFRKLSKLEESIENVADGQESIKNWIFLKNVDLIKVFDAVVYHAKIDNKLCDIKSIISKVEHGFSQLKWIKCRCSAIMCYKNK